MYISVANICEMISNEQQVDIILTVLNVNKSLPHFLTDQVNKLIKKIVFRNLLCGLFM